MGNDNSSQMESKESIQTTTSLSCAFMLGMHSRQKALLGTFMAIFSFRLSRMLRVRVLKRGWLCVMAASGKKRERGAPLCGSGQDGGEVKSGQPNLKHGNSDS